MAIELEKLLNNCAEYAERHGKDFRWGTVATHDADTTDQRVAIAYWWDETLGKLQTMLHAKFGYEALTTHFDDEVAYCEHCGKVILTQPTSYGWLPNFMYVNGEPICRECVIENPEWLVTNHFDNEYINGTKHAFLPWFVEALEKNGWKCFQPDTDGCAHYETGWYEGQVDDPETVARFLADEMPDYDHAFVITSVGQFDTHWTVYIRKRDEE